MSPINLADLENWLSVYRTPFLLGWATAEDQTRSTGVSQPCGDFFIWLGALDSDSIFATINPATAGSLYPMPISIGASAPAYAIESQSSPAFQTQNEVANTPPLQGANAHEDESSSDQTADTTDRELAQAQGIERPLAALNRNDDYPIRTGMGAKPIKKLAVMEEPIAIHRQSTAAENPNNTELLAAALGSYIPPPPVEVRFTTITDTTIGAEFWIDAGMSLENLDFVMSIAQTASLPLSAAGLSIDFTNFPDWSAFLEPDPQTPGDYLMSAFSGSLNPVADPLTPIRFASFQLNRIGASADVLHIDIKGLILKSTEIPGIASFALPLVASVSIFPVVTLVTESATLDSRKIVFEIHLDRALLTTESLSWALERIESNETSATDFDGAVQGRIELPAGQSHARIDIAIADDEIAETDELFRLRLSNPSLGLRLPTDPVSGPVTVLSDDTIQTGGLVYHWKTHDLMSAVQMAAIGSSAHRPDPGQLLDLREASFDPTTRVFTADLWINPRGTAKNFNFRVGADGSADQISFVSTLDSHWTLGTSGGNGNDLLVSSILTSQDAKAIEDSQPIGKLVIELATGTSTTTIALTETTVGGQSQSDQLVELISTLTDTDGAYLLASGLSSERHFEVRANLQESPLAIDSAITSADAMAALKMALGRNPNPDPDGPGPLLPMPVSPYQWIAADLDRDGIVTRADAQEILKQAHGQPSTNGSASRWVFVDELADLSKITRAASAAPLIKSVEMTESTTQRNLVGILLGDIDGTWAAPPGSASLATSYFEELISANPGLLTRPQFWLLPTPTI